MDGPHRILTHDKSFASAWIGNRALNAAGLHPARIVFADWMLRVRRRQVDDGLRSSLISTLHRDGVVAVPDFLPPGRFASLQEEVRREIRATHRQHPPTANTAKGFGAPRPFSGGFDRWDGGTLNRFIAIAKSKTPECARFVEEPQIRSACSMAAGYRYRAHKFWIGEIINGDEAANGDSQKKFHRDTFHAAFKVWYFTEDVGAEDGPFSYVPGSHRMTRQRYRWEYRRSRDAARHNAGGAFRVTREEMRMMGLPAPKTYAVKKNTLVLADVRGFHRRGDASPGSRRYALHASFRPSPFAPVVY